MLRWLGTLALASTLLCAGGAAPAQEGSAPRPASVPFGPGERMEYDVSLGVLHVGDGYFHVSGPELVRGHPTYRLEMHLHGGTMFVKVDDNMTSWLDINTLVARRFEQDQKEFRYKRQRTLEFYPEEKRYFQPEKNEHGAIATDEPLDDVSFLYYVRTLPLEVGQTYTLHRYFDPDGNPVTVKVVRKDTVKVPAGTFRTIVVQPVIQTKGLFGKGGRAEVYFSDDERRLVVQVRSSVPVVGSLNMYLKSYQPGRPLGSGWGAQAKR